MSYNINPQDVNSHPYYAGYFQDQWRATRNLTLTLGLRYNVELGSKEKSDHYVYLDTTSPSPLSVPGYNLVGGLAFAGVNGQSRRAEQADWTIGIRVSVSLIESATRRCCGQASESSTIPWCPPIET